MPVVQRCQLPFAQSLHNGQHRRVDETDAGVRILLADVRSAGIILGQQVLDEVVASCDVPQEFGQDFRCQPGGHEVSGFVRDGRWDNQPFARSLQQNPRALMVGISPIVRRE